MKDYSSLLNFDASFRTNIGLYEAEDICKKDLYSHSKPYIVAWEYGYYFISLFIGKSSIHYSYGVIASLFTEAHSALRGSFLLNLYGYHGDSIVLLRKTHESLIRAIAIRIKSSLTWNIVQEKSIKKLENRYLKIDLSKVYKIESSFTHSNQMKAFEVGMKINSGNKEYGISYGPQIDAKTFSLTAKLSIFWLYSMIQSIPYLFKEQVQDYWMAKKEASTQYMFDYLKEGKSSLAEDTQKINKALSLI